MNVETIIARAAPPPERAGGAFEPAGGDDRSFALRRARLTEAFGSPERLAAHAESLGLSTAAWLERFRDVRLTGGLPDWARAFRALMERLADRPGSLAGASRWGRKEAGAAWPRDLPHGPDVLAGPVEFLLGRLGVALQPTLEIERRLNARTGWEARFRRSPALAYVFGRIAADWSADLARMARRAAVDRRLFARAFFGGEESGSLLRIEPGLGDPHAAGRSVAILHFERGAVVYKPKDLRVVPAVRDIARAMGDPRLAVPATLIRDGYAWEPVYGESTLSGAGDADAFFRALGGWLALLQALGGTDFWFDNLIADGPVPRFIDFETAIQPVERLQRGARPLSGAAGTLDRMPPGGVGILPMLMPLRDGEDATDIGCMTRPGTHRTPLADMAGGGLIEWRDERFAPRYTHGAAADAADHFEAFEDGYLRAVRALAGARMQERILTALGAVRDAPVRSIRLDTWTCYRMINRSLLPRHLGDSAWREIALHDAGPRLRKVIGAIREGTVRDLRRMDVPLFWTRLDSRSLFGVEGECLREYFDEDALTGAGRRLRELAGLREEEHRAWLRTGLGLRAGNRPWRPATVRRLAPARAGELLAWADEIASTIARHAITDDQRRPTWVGVYHDVFTGVRGLAPLGFDMLSGRGGVARALLELAGGLDRPDLADLARETLTGAARDYLELSDMFLKFGAGYAVGAGGLVATLARAPGLRPKAAELFRFAASKEIWMRSGGDFAGGLAGWREAASALGEPAPQRHGPGRSYSPSGRARLAGWREPGHMAPLCADRRAAARLRRDRDRHGSWFAASWVDDRHNLSGLDGLPALAVRFLHLARP